MVIPTTLSNAIRLALTSGLVFTGMSAQAVFADTFLPGNLIVSRTVYQGTDSTVTIGQTLPGGGVAVGNGSFAQVFSNEVPDPSFGVTSPIFLDQMTTSGGLVSSLAIDAGVMTTSFASKSEMALNIASDGKSVAFMGYAAPQNTMDVSNSNTAQVADSTNPVKSTYSRAIASVDLSSGNVQVTNVNAYSGNNGRAAVQASGQYYMVGNAGNGSATGAVLSQLSDNTGVQTIAVASSGNTSAIGAVQGTSGSSTGYQHGFALQQLTNPATGTAYAADKTGKDDNFRGMTVANDTLFVSKGSGSNGVDTVYQVGATGALANGGVLPSNAAITILPGFNALSEKASETAAGTTNPITTPHPFGLWFADANTLFVADEGDGVRMNTNGTVPVNKAMSLAGLEEWKFDGTKWNDVANFQKGLLDQTAFNTGLTWNVYTDGLRNITGEVNADGSFTIFGTTSTVSNEQTHDLGADPNQLVAITIGAGSTVTNTSFTILSQAVAGQRFGGVALAPAAVPVPGAAWLLGSGLLGLLGLARKRQAS